MFQSRFWWERGGRVLHDGNRHDRDFDLVTPWQEEVEAALKELGFERPRDGTRGLQHYGENIGVEIVGSAPMEGYADRNRIWDVEIAEGLTVRLIGAEDLIADRVAQFQSQSGGSRSRLEQAIILFDILEKRLDKTYLDKQIRVQGPGLTASWLEEQVRAAREAGRLGKRNLSAP